MEGLDLDGFVELLKEDATYTMPPLRQLYAGRDAIRAFHRIVWKAFSGFRLSPTGANGSRPSPRRQRCHARSLGRALHPDPYSRPRQDCRTDLLRETR